MFRKLLLKMYEISQVEVGGYISFWGDLAFGLSLLVETE